MIEELSFLFEHAGRIIFLVFPPLSLSATDHTLDLLITSY
jgi:hypothetical protein